MGRHYVRAVRSALRWLAFGSGHPAGWRLAAPFALALIALAAVSALAIWQTRADKAAHSRAMQQTSRALSLALDIRATRLQAHADMKNLWLRGDHPADYTLYADRFEQRAAYIRELRQQLDELLPFLDEGERNSIAELDRIWTAYYDAWRQGLDAYGGPTRHDARAADAAVYRKDDGLDAALNRLVDGLRTRMRADARQAAEAEQTAALHLAGLLGLTMLLGLVVAMLAARATTRTLRQTAAMGEAAKFRALGQLAGGVAHDVNQSLGIIAGYGEIAFAALSGPEPDLARAREGLELVTRAAMDAGETVSRLLRFTRSAPDGPSTRVDVGDVLADVAKLTAPAWRDRARAKGRQITVEVATTGDTAIVGWAARLREALTNLVLNAVDALPSGGTIRLSARRIEGDVVVSVSDDGVGMTPEVQAHVFEPFFTTKGERGTGLGLAMVFGIVEQHGGRIDVTSSPGRGTTFTIRMPAAPSEAVAPMPRSRAVYGRPLRVLAVDDEPALARMVALMMGQQGHQVGVATSAEAALGRLADEPFDVVISDLGMGNGMTGWELLDEVRRRWPHVRFVLATGWGAEIDAEAAHRRGADAVIAKPYRIADLNRAAVGG
ncbi:MAG TPA: ATP-binding protein [Chloroflexota bacterium]|nr:ATP-binding protein [Chloroflexota bacterium]